MGAPLTQRDSAVLTITLNRPDALNTLNVGLHAALRDALDEAAERTIRAVVITGEGRAFCAGQDVAEFDGLTEGVAKHLEATYHGNIRRIRALEKPVIAAVNGAVAGAGLSLASACDVRVASSAAVFVPGFVGLGLVPDSGATWFLPRIIGPARTFEWMCTNRRLEADEALAWGLVSEVFAADEFSARAAELAATWAQLPTSAVGMMKKLFDQGHDATLDDQLAAEAELQEVAIGSADFAEGIAAFRAKRPATFSGR